MQKRPTVKQANQKWRHERKRRNKAKTEKMRSINRMEARGRRKHGQEIYLNNLRADIEA